MLERGIHGKAIRKHYHILQQLFWECTLRCNLRCRHCGSDCKIGDTRKDMPLVDLIRVLDDVCRKMNPHKMLIITTGGEPLVRQDISACGRAIKERGFYWGLVTNGLLLTEKRMTELVDAGLDAISISLDGLKEEHNWMRRHEQSFDKAVNAIKLVINNDANLSYDVITCVNQRNYCQLPELRDFLIKLGVKRWRLITVFPSGRAKDDKELQLNGNQLRQLMDFIATTRKEGKMKTSYGCEGFLGPYEYEVRDYPFFCQAGINVASILHDGSISGCLSIRSEYNQGNIYEDSFSDVWKNGFSQYRSRSWMQTGICKDCEAWRWCEGGAMHLRADNGSLMTCNYDRMFKLSDVDITSMEEPVGGNSTFSSEQTLCHFGHEFKNNINKKNNSYE